MKTKTLLKRGIFLVGLLTVLLCFDNVAYANDTPVPRLFVKDISITEVDGDEDGGIDPGETIDISIILINSGLEVMELSGFLTTENRDVTILEEEAYFKTIPCEGEGISTPLRFKVSPDLQANRDGRLKFVFNITSITAPAEEIRFLEKFVFFNFLRYNFFIRRNP